jgi:hypothetical protein
MRTLPALLAAAFALALVTGAPRASATGPETADSLFEAGVAARDRSDYAEAYKNFVRSQQLDPAPGTLLNMALCEEKLGKLASALAHLEEVVRQLPEKDGRTSISRARAAALRRRVPRLVVRLEPGAPPGTRMMRDGIPLGASSLGTPVLLDPGRHVVVVIAPGGTERRFDVVLEEGEARVLEASGPPQSRGVRWPIGFVLVGLGAASLTAGITTGILVLQDKSTVQKSCDLKQEICTSQDGIDAAKRGRVLSIVSTATFIAGLAGVGAGAGLLLSTVGGRPPGVAVTPIIGPGGAFLSAAVRF